MDQKFKMDEETYLCFYITNVCNLTCEGCITYNDFKFKGHMTYTESHQKIQDWAKLIDPPKICILGGEPYANPDLINWVTGIRQAWPNLDDICVCTNGTYLNKVELSRNIINQRLWIDVSLHDPDHYNLAKTRVEEIMSVYDYNIKVTTGTNMTNATYTEENYYIGDRLAVKFSQVYEFGSNSTKAIINNTIHMHTSDPETAHSNCKANLCHYMVRGDLYKCFLTGTSKELLSRFNIDNNSRDALLSTKSCSPYDPIDKIQQFLENLKNHIPQCTLCPENRINKKLWPLKPIKSSL